MKLMVFIIITTLPLLSCVRDKNPVDTAPSPWGAGNLVLKTDKSDYSWRQGESNFHIIIEGTLENKSTYTFYSQVGDGFGPPEQHQLLFANNSAGSIEKFDDSDKSWEEIHVLGLLIEGSRTIPIKPSINYNIYAHLSRDKDEIEKGKYRLRIDYNENSDLNDAETQFQDFSNVFEIK